jgi:uroporphyrinogen decarboxylase
VDYNIKIVEQASKFEIDGVMFGDDWGQQSGMIMGPKLWRRFLKPRLAKMYKKVKDAGLFVFIHSCGDVTEVFPDLIEIGLDVFNPIQPEVIDVYEIKKKYGDKLSFFGGISTQKLLPYGTPDDVKREVRKFAKEIGNNGGYIIAPAHATPGDVPVENIIALIEAVQNQ